MEGCRSDGKWADIEMEVREGKAGREGVCRAAAGAQGEIEVEVGAERQVDGGMQAARREERGIVVERKHEEGYNTGAAKGGVAGVDAFLKVVKSVAGEVDSGCVSRY